jgi:hypothetical protein
MSRRQRIGRCECGDDLPGHCPGPAACPYASKPDDDELDDLRDLADDVDLPDDDFPDDDEALYR